jgi:hypothetical protein
VTRGPVQNDMHDIGPIASGYRGDATHTDLTGHLFMHVQSIIHLS